MTLTFERVLAALAVVQRLAQQRFPAGHQKTVYTINKLRKVLLVEDELFQTQRKHLIEELGQSRPASLAERQAGTDAIIWEVAQQGPRWVEFITRMREILGINVDIEAPLLALDALDGVELSAMDVEALEPFLEETSRNLLQTSPPRPESSSATITVSAHRHP